MGLVHLAAAPGLTITPNFSPFPNPCPRRALDGTAPDPSCSSGDYEIPKSDVFLTVRYAETRLLSADFNPPTKVQATVLTSPPSLAVHAQPYRNSPF